MTEQDAIMVRGQPWMRAVYDQHCRDLATLLDAETAIRRSDADAFFDALSRLDFAIDGWRRLMLRVARMECRPSAEFRRRFLFAMSTHGDHIRQECSDDLLLVRALRAIFPPYRGPELTLYRGEGAQNRRRRTYGLSWSRDREVADSFAQGLWRDTEGGSVLLEAVAPSEAIILVMRSGHHPGEREVWVDRRHLQRVRVLTRYEQRQTSP